MTKLLERAMERAQALPAEMQDEIARMVLSFAGDDEPMIELTLEEEADLAEALAEIGRGELATEDEVKAVFGRSRA